MAEPLSIAGLREAARRRLPRAVFDFIDGGAQDECTLRANRAEFDALPLRPRVLVDVGVRDLRTTVLGRAVALPLLVAPTGLTGLATPQGELHARRAAAALGTIYCLSTNASCSIEAVAAAAPGPFWFQLYAMRDRGLTRDLVQRARAAGCDALVLTVDLVQQGRRERDLRNGFTVPPRLSLRNALDMLRHGRWVLDQLRAPRLEFANYPSGADRGVVELAQLIAAQFDATLTWDDLAALRDAFGGPLVLKGLLHPDDARRAVEHGVDAVIVSNHGGRQLDGACSAIAALPAIVAAVGGRAEVLLDGGVRRGADIVRALALGARAVLVGRPVLWGLAALGPRGAEHALTILRDELDHCLALLGVPAVRALDAHCLHDPRAAPPVQAAARVAQT